MNLLDAIHSPADLRRLPPAQLEALARELRRFLLDSVAQTGGHLSSNLGSVELTIALHYVFGTPRDRLVWDVGHQCYGHEVLTGRRGRMHTLRQLGGLSGFPRRAESACDCFGTAHSSTSISAALGMASEALNNAGHRQDLRLLVILNDNGMAISPSVGAFNRYCTRRRDGHALPSTATMFEELGFHSSGTPARRPASAFHMAMRVLPAHQRQAIFDIHAFCRALDDVAACYAGRTAPRVEALARHVKAFGLAREDFHAVIDGMLMDAQDRPLCAPPAAALDLYCDRVASAVGRLSVRVFGLPADDGIRLAHHLGRAPRLMGATCRALLARLERRGWHHPRAAVRVGKLERIGILLRHGMG